MENVRKSVAFVASLLRAKQLEGQIKRLGIVRKDYNISVDELEKEIEIIEAMANKRLKN